jgi:hypothetical protein
MSNTGLDSGGGVGAPKEVNGMLQDSVDDYSYSG